MYKKIFMLPINIFGKINVDKNDTLHLYLIAKKLLVLVYFSTKEILLI